MDYLSYRKSNIQCLGYFWNENLQKSWTDKNSVPYFFQKILKIRFICGSFYQFVWYSIGCLNLPTSAVYFLTIFGYFWPIFHRQILTTRGGFASLTTVNHNMKIPWPLGTFLSVNEITIRKSQFLPNLYLVRFLKLSHSSINNVIRYQNHHF